MLLAEIHGKTRGNYLEDYLTSDVLGALKYLPADAGIIGYS